MILTVCNYKGGVGKSTIALNIALIRAIQGAKVWAIDGDRQATLSIALSMREGHLAGTSGQDHQWAKTC